MGKMMKDTIHANGKDIRMYTADFENDFISLTDIAQLYIRHWFILISVSLV